MKTIDEALGFGDPDATLRAIRETIEEKLGAGIPLTEGEEVVWNVHSFVVEVFNGGINQYLWNPIGQSAMETLEALRAVGAERTREILYRVVEKFSDGVVPTDRTSRGAALELIEDQAGDLFDDVDRQMYSAPEDLRGLLFRFVTQNSARFRSPP